MEVRDKREVDLCFKPSRGVRKELSRPYGILFSDTAKLISYLSNFNRIVTVGDVVTNSVISAKLTPFLTVVDGKTKRSISVTPHSIGKTIVNEPGLLRLSTMLKIKEIMEGDSPTSVFIVGEDDMIVIPAIIYGRKGDVVVYGQPNAGAVCLENWEGSKWRVMDILSKFVVERC
ncbi:GTP-dependent dephospho-CoA kinase family protein [Metallosphaera hakonensis]|uniref:GTP-dependent dephospho-CoA kinase n=1 Tax=Metallosphaera hakonensis JCM 8857 = DSM 7519 TaxID=1293036 RepID=A0A2U9IU05_9CREN|nr:DUF359 domain-containing protein [Metallosphaera hakonensis]AWR99529.1 DUF359 domain-containing protein [Metallosphaera hakonensis JCM 8857 = DSM 7519]